MLQLKFILTTMLLVTKLTDGNALLSLPRLLTRRMVMSDSSSAPRSRFFSSGGRGESRIGGRGVTGMPGRGSTKDNGDRSSSNDGFATSSSWSSSSGTGTYTRRPAADGRGSSSGGRSSSFGGRGGRSTSGGGRFSSGNSVASPNRYQYSRDGGSSGGGYSDNSYNSYNGWVDDRDPNREPPCGRYDGDHLYGISPIRLAMVSGRRNITELLVQEGMDMDNKKDAKAASDILKIAKDKGITIREFPKHDLNMLTENRPHQGFVLRAAPLQFQKIDSLPAVDQFQCVLALDEVWDPQNFGALLRTSHFLGVDKVVVCAKNSAPLSPVVSKASSGALEVLQVSSADNMMRFLDKSMENGWQVVGTALGETSMNLEALPLTAPTILVLGNEGHGIRTNILRRCTHLVKIPGGVADPTIAGSSDGGIDASFSVDSLNVSVTGGILLHHILKKKQQNKSM